MIFIFAVSILYTLIYQKDDLLQNKGHIFLFLILSGIGVALGIIYVYNPYLPSITKLLADRK
jgi:hypothetical protein